MLKKIFITLLIFLTIIIIIFTGLIYFHPGNSFHFEKALGFQILDDNNILVTDGGGHKWENSGSKVFIINRKGKILWRYDDVKFAHSAICLKNGNILIPDSNRDRIIEVNKNKEIVWSSESWGNGTGILSDGVKIDYPNYVEELDDGKFLISARFSDAVYEVDRQGKIYWSYKKLKKQHAPRRLPDGNTIISDSNGNRIIEVNRKGETVWEYSQGLSWPRHAFRCENGDTLIADSNNDRVIRVTRDGKIVFVYGNGELAKPYQVEELKNGNIMISDAQHGRLLEVDKNKKIVWKFESKNRLKIWLDLPWKLKNGGAEELDKNQLPKYWVKCDLIAPDYGVWSIDENIKYSGKRSFKIEGQGNDASNKFWAQYIKILHAKKTEFICRIKTKGVVYGAGASINFADARGGLLGGVNSKVFTGDNEWSEIVILSPVPKKTAIMAVLLSIVGPGTAWWDEVELIVE